MTTTDTLEHELIRDLETLGGRLADERLTRDLYRALTDHALFKRGRNGHLSLSGQRADEIVNAPRAELGLLPLEDLPQSGGEGELTERARAVLQELGWEARPLTTGRHEEAARNR
jgi:hypothetical protein